MRSIVGVAAASLVSSLAFAACVGDDPGSAPPADPDGGSFDDVDARPACAGDTVEACGDACTPCVAPAGGTVACVDRACVPSCVGQTACDDACVDTQTAAAHCGRCGHSCGAGSCVEGACQAVTVATFTEVKGIAASPRGIVIAADDEVALCARDGGCTGATSLTTITSGVNQLNTVTVATSGTSATIFWDGNEGDYEIVFRCPVDGCPPGGPGTVSQVVNDSIGRVVASGNTLLWTHYDGTFGPYSMKCTLPACATEDIVRPIGSTPSYGSLASRELAVPTRIFSVGATKTIWATGNLANDNDKQLRFCTYGFACTTPGEISRGDLYGVSALTYFEGTHYVAMGNASGTINVVASISDAEPSAPQPLVNDAAGIRAVAVDASGIYWVNGTTGRVARCATLTGCVGSGETLAIGETGAFDVALDETYVYWATATAVRKIAK